MLCADDFARQTADTKDTFKFNHLPTGRVLIFVFAVSLLFSGIFIGSMFWLGTEQMIAVVIITAISGILLAMISFFLVIPEWVRQHETITLGDKVIHSRMHGDIRLADIVSFGTMDYNGSSIKIKTRTAAYRYSVSQFESVRTLKIMAAHIQAMIDAYNVEQDWTEQTGDSPRRHIADNSFFSSTWGLVFVILFTLGVAVILFSPAAQTALKVMLSFGVAGFWASIINARAKKR